MPNWKYSSCSGAAACLTAAIALTATVPALAAGLCGKDEVTLFSCDTAAKTASVCASSPLSPLSRVQYRFGVAGKVELVWPEGVTREGLSYGSYAFSGGGGLYMRFVKDKAVYGVFSATVKVGAQRINKDIEGIVAENDGKVVAARSCNHVRGDQPLKVSFDDLAKLGLTNDDTPQLDIPDALWPK